MHHEITVICSFHLVNQQQCSLAGGKTGTEMNANIHIHFVFIKINKPKRSKVVLRKTLKKITKKVSQDFKLGIKKNNHPLHKVNGFFRIPYYTLPYSPFQIIVVLQWARSNALVWN